MRPQSVRRPLLAGVVAALAVVLAPLAATDAAPAPMSATTTAATPASAQVSSPKATTASRPVTKTTRGWHLNAKRVGLRPFGLSCDDLPRYRGPARPSSGSVIKGRLVTKPLDLSAGHILVAKSCIRPTTTGYHNQFLVTTTTCRATCWATKGGHVTVRDSEISGLGMDASEVAGSCGFLGVGRVVRTYIHGMGSGICFFETGKRYNALALNNYVTGLRSYGESHNEAATVRDFRKNRANSRTAQFIGNRFNCSSGNVTGGIFIQPTWVDIYNVQVRRNYIEGEGYNLFVSGTSVQGVDSRYGNIVSTNNRFRSTGWGPSAVTAPPGWRTWHDNYLFARDRPGARGARVRQ